MRTNRLIAACWLAAVFLCGGVGAHAQTKSEPRALVPAVERDHKAEQQLTVALLEEIHKQGGMVPKLITPTDFAVQMTCSAAVDEDREADAQAHGITITQADVADVSLLLDSLAKSVHATKDQPSIWLVVFRTTDDEGIRTLTVGYSMVESTFNHLKKCFLTEDGCSDNTWQKSVAPACRHFR
jgi:hypothetical protein